MTSVKQLTLTKKSSNFVTRKNNERKEMREQCLFLIEFYVHSISGERLAKLNQMFFVPTSVRFKFLTFNDDSIEVTPVDPMFEPQAGIADEIEYFYSGKSVMFSIAEDVMLNKISEFNVGLIIEKKMPDNIKPNVLVGVSFIDLSKEFSDLKIDIKRCMDNNEIPNAKYCEGEYPILLNGDQVGDIKIYTRLSAFGETIVTEFEAPPYSTEDKKPSTFYFRGDEIDEKILTYKCRIIDSGNIDLCKDSNEEIQGECPVCLPQKYKCLPCGLDYGAISRPITPGQIEKSSSIQNPASYPSPDIFSGRPIQSSRGIQPCGKAVVLKVSGLLETESGDGKKKQPTVTVVSESEATGPNSPEDPEHDIFILRIGKKGLVAAGEKSDLQLEMRTPKGPERRPPIRYETRESQTETGKGGKGKGKGKGKKGKK